MKAKLQPILEMAIQNGILIGIRRAYKHTDQPGEDLMSVKIEEAIWEEIHEWFQFGEDDHHHD